MAIQVLTTYCAHDVCHDLESAIWLLLCMVLRHTRQVEQDDDDEDPNSVPQEFERYGWYRKYFAATTEANSANDKNSFLVVGMEWAVKDNKPLTELINRLKILVRRQTRRAEAGDEDPIPLTYRSVLTEFNRALSSPGWPENDAALPFTLTRDCDSSESQGKKRDREDDEMDLGNDASSSLPRREAKRPMMEPSPLRNQVVGDPLEEDLGDE